MSTTGDRVFPGGVLLLNAPVYMLAITHLRVLYWPSHPIGGPIDTIWYFSAMFAPTCFVISIVFMLAMRSFAEVRPAAAWSVHAMLVASALVLTWVHMTTR